MDHDTLEAGKHVVDAVSILAVVGTVLEQLPHVTAVFTLLWVLVRFYETATIQKLFHGKDKDDA